MASRKEELRAKESSRGRRNVLVTAAVAALGGLLFGYDTGIVASAILFIRHDFDLGDFGQGAVVSAVTLGAIIGAPIAGTLADRFGRRRMILIASVIFIVGSVGCAAAPNVEVLVVARVVLGIAVGLASATCPVYIAEVAPVAARGQLVTLFQLAVTVGILVAYLVGLAFESSGGWREMLGLGALPALALGAGMLYMPRSPRWLVMIGERSEARTVLRATREDETEVDDELAEIEATLQQDQGTYRDLLTPAMRAALTVGVGLAILQQITGINTVIYYAPTIVEFAGISSSSSAILASIGVGVVNVAVTVLAIRLLKNHGRRQLLLVGVAGMVLSLVSLGIAFMLGTDSGATAPIAIVSLMVYVASFAMSLGPIFWLLNAEIYPLRVRAKAAGVGTMSNWTFNFIVALTFLPLLAAVGNSAAFFIYAGIGVFTWFFCMLLVPETKDMPLEEIEQEWDRRAGVEPAAAEPPV